MWIVFSTSRASRPRLDRRMAEIGGSLAVLLGTSAAGVFSLVEHLRLQDGSPLRAPAGLVLIVLAFVQARLLLLHLTARDSAARPLGAWLRDLCVGLALCYLATLAVGRQPGAGFLFAALAAGWYTLLIARPVDVVAPTLVARLRSHWLARGAASTFLVLLAAAAAAELGLRGYGWIFGDHLSIAASARARQLTPGTTVRGAPVNRLGYWGGDFHQQPQGDLLRIAVVGDEAALAGDGSTNCFAQLERSLPGVEFYNFAVPQSGPREYAALVRSPVFDYRPHLVLVIVSIGDDITERTPAPGAFDVRGLRLYQAAAARWIESGGQRAPAADADAERCQRRSFLERAERQLIVCRTPLEPPVRAHWDDALAHLDSAIDQVRSRGAEVALVGVPAVYQASPSLLSQLRRRAGWDADGIDLELPQRRLAGFAASRQVPWIDLLPALKGTSVPAFERSSTELSPAGNRAAAQTLEHWIVGRYQQLLSPATQASAR